MNKRQHNKQKAFRTIFEPKKNRHNLRYHYADSTTLVVNHKTHTFEIWNEDFETIKPLPFSFLSYYIGTWNNRQKIENATQQLLNNNPDYFVTYN